MPFSSYLYRKMALLYVPYKSYIKAEAHITQSFLHISLLNVIAEYGGSVAEQCLILQKTWRLR